jgi:regulator of protease activity HflC (stomatin/prohibitin superfamily)
MKLIRYPVKRSIFFLLFLVGALTSCYCARTIDENEVGLHMSDGISVDRTLASGRYSDNSYWSKLVEVDTSSKTNIWEDPDVATKDKQQIGVQVGVTYRRGPSAEAVLRMWQTYRNEAVNDDALWQQVSNRISRVLKNITTSYSLDQLLGVADDDTSRALIADILLEDLQTELNDVGVTIVDVGINNISPSESYRQLLEQKAAAQAAVEIAVQNKRKAEEELGQVQAETEIELELARRERLVAEEQNKVFEESPLAYELERMRVMSEMLGDNDKIIFVPTEGNLNLFLGSGILEGE